MESKSSKQEEQQIFSIEKNSWLNKAHLVFVNLPVKRRKFNKEHSNSNTKSQRLKQYK
jgi:hypothetical protein